MHSRGSRSGVFDAAYISNMSVKCGWRLTWTVKCLGISFATTLF
jgi:hypothetical protein